MGQNSLTHLKGLSSNRTEASVTTTAEVAKGRPNCVSVKLRSSYPIVMRRGRPTRESGLRFHAQETFTDAAKRALFAQAV